MVPFLDRLTEDYRLLVEQTYNDFVRNYFGNQRRADVFIGLLIMVGLYWIVGLLYTSIDITKRPKWFLRYKIQPISQVNKASLRKLIKQVIINQIWGAVIGFFLIQFRNRYFEPSKHVPTISGFLFEWIICSLIREALFYYSHRLLHHPSIYKYIHKRHHEWQTPVALVAIYSHPIEHAISNVIPVMAGPMLLRSHPLVGYLWTSYVILHTLNAHCGYHFPFFSPPIFHDYHHLKFNVNYGINGLLDWFHGTDKMFRNSKYYSLNRIYFSLFPPKEFSLIKAE